MRKRRWTISGVCGFLAVLTGVSTAETVLTASAIDAGGRCVTGATCRIDGSIGGIGGVSSSASPPETVKHGYIGQLTEVTNIVVLAAPNPANEGDVSQLRAIAGLDDATVTALAGSDLAWAAAAFPIASITPAGAATAAAVWSDTWGTVTGAYLGVSGSGLVLVQDSNPDNYGLYAGDQVPDGWQVLYFGPNNPLGMGAATNCTGQNNLCCYVADLNPANPTSCLEIIAISNQAPDRLVSFASSSTGRLYRLAYTTNLLDVAWTNLPGAAWTTGLAGQMSLNDTNAAAIRFYRVQVKAP